MTYAFYRPFFSTTAEPSIALNVSENANTYTVRAALPGVAKEHIAVRVDNATVHLDVEFKPTVPEGASALWVDAQYRQIGKANRQIELPQAVDTDAAQARYENGELILSLPKKQVSSQRQLQIQ
ncbi:MAG: hypothetical protein RLZZ502_897 [Pseudomonadota bacterium]